jgi:hypothetical protein
VQDDWRLGRLLLKPGLRYQRQFWADPADEVSNIGGTRLQYAISQGGSFAPRLAAACDPAGNGRTSIHAAYGRYDDYQILAGVVTGQIANGSTGVRTLALRLPASIAAWNAPGHRLAEPASAFPSVEILLQLSHEIPTPRPSRHSTWTPRQSPLRDATRCRAIPRISVSQLIAPRWIDE